jgi:lysophospholipid acyltransferase (LPLAT)-like uncharacterized protein
MRIFRHYFWTTGEPWRTIRLWLIPRILRVMHSLLMCTLRISTSGVQECWPKRGDGALIVIWHDLTFIALHLFRNQDIHAMMSTSRAGRIQAAFWNLYGFKTVWGSTNKREGIRALRVTLNGLREGKWFAFTPDGPKGPRHQAQPGVIYLATNTGVAVVPIGIAASAYWKLSTWDRYLIPKPFARVHIHVGPNITVPEKLPREQNPEWQNKIAGWLDDADREAERRLRLSPGA